VAGGIDYTIQRWELSTGAKTALSGHDNWVRTLGFSPDGATLYSGSYDGYVNSWDIGAAAPQTTRRIQAHQGWLRGLAVSSDGHRLATCGNDRLVKIWSTNDGKLLQELPGHASIPYCVHFVPGSQELVSGDITGNIHHWGSENGQLIRKFNAAEIHNLIGDRAPFGGIINLCFAPNSKRLTVTGLHKTSNALAGNRRAVALTFDWVNGEKVLKQESIKKEIDSTMWRGLYHASGIFLGVVQKEIGFWNPSEVDLFHSLATPSDIFDFDLHPNQLDLYTAHFDGHLRCYRLAANSM
jgi:WD40 repeat protein